MQYRWLLVSLLCAGSTVPVAGQQPLDERVLPREVAEFFWGAGIRLFEGYEAVVAPSGSCVAMVRVFYNQLKLEPSFRERLDILRGRIWEFTEFLVDVLKAENVGGIFPHRVTYHDSCHLSRELGVREQPRRLIRSLKEVDFVEMERPDLCCGFGGTFSYKFKELSVAMVRRKCEQIEATGAEFCVGADSSCLMNIEGYLRKHGMKARTLHIADLLAESLGLSVREESR